jgi:hypothetical protein
MLMTRNLLVLFTLVTLIGLPACRTIRQATSSNNPEPPAKTEAEKAAQKRSLAPFTILEGTPYRVANVNQKWGESKGLLSSDSSSRDYQETTRNHIFLNVENKASVKLLPKSDAIFTRFEKIGKLDANGKLTKVEALWYQVIQHDSNGDQKLDYQDKSTIATSTISGESYTELIPKVDRILNTFQSSPTKILMIYELDQQYFVAELDLGSRKLIDTKALPTLE